MLPFYYRMTRYRGRPDLSKVSEVNPVDFEKPLSDVSRVFTGEAMEEAATPHRETQDLVSESFSFPHLFREKIHRLRSLWSPYDPQRRVEHPLQIVVGWKDQNVPEKVLEAARFWAGKYHSQLVFPQSAMSPEALILLGQGRPSVLMVLARELSEEQPRPHETSLIEAVLSRADFPILVVPSRGPASGIKKILLPVEGSSFSYEAISQALLLAHDFKAELDVIHVTEKSSQLQKDLPAWHRILEKMDWGEIHPEWIEVQGDVSTVLLCVAQAQEIDLIVMGTHYPQGKDREQGSSVTFKVVNDAPCPVLVLHPEE